MIVYINTLYFIFLFIHSKWYTYLSLSYHQPPRPWSRYRNHQLICHPWIQIRNGCVDQCHLLRTKNKVTIYGNLLLIELSNWKSTKISYITPHVEYNIGLNRFVRFIVRYIYLNILCKQYRWLYISLIWYICDERSIRADIL